MPETPRPDEADEREPQAPEDDTTLFGMHLPRHVADRLRERYRNGMFGTRRVAVEREGTSNS